MTANNTRYFYTDPLAAAWMDANYHMLFENDFHIDYLYVARHAKTTPYMSDGSPELRDKYYIHPDSLPLLKPQDGDLCFENGWGYLRWKDLENMAGHVRDDSFKIIQRNGIPFHWPQSEPAA
jgi:hypothetical protein